MPLPPPPPSHAYALPPPPPPPLYLPQSGSTLVSANEMHEISFSEVALMKCTQIAADVARYLAVLHSSNVSVQPSLESIFLNREGRARIIDLELAGEPNHQGKPCGRKGYSAPEQWVDGGGLYSDVFGKNCFIYIYCRPMCILVLLL